MSEEEKDQSEDLLPDEPQDQLSITQHSITIDQKEIHYTVTAGTIVLKEEQEKGSKSHGEKAKASVFFVAYTLDNTGDTDKRPITFSFNGGPGSSSVWLHLGVLGPRCVETDQQGNLLQPPYRLIENQYSVLDQTDLVFIDPISTGFSRVVQGEEAKQFHGFKKDIESIGDFIRLYTTRYQRWTSPKFLIGESYGTIRVSGLALALQNKQWMYLNGVILVSPTELGIHSSRPQADGRTGPLGAALRLPYFTATAWYQKFLPQVLALSEDYSINELIPLMAKGNSATDAEKQEAAKTMARFSGISENAIMSYNLDVPTTFFWKELLRDEGYTIGRLDSRYKGIDKIAGGDRPDYWAELTSWNHSFAPAINYYFKNVLKFETDVKYNLFGSVYPWDWKNNNSGESLRKAMAANPYLHTMIQSGYYDGATRYFDAKYTMWQLDPSGKMKDRLSFEGYRSGHMMYLREVDLIKSNSDIRKFIKKTTPSSNKPAKY